MTSAKEKYRKGKGAGGQKGVDYQVNILALFALEGLSVTAEWKLSTENKDCDKFDDVVYQSSDGDLLLQCKHKENLQLLAEKQVLSVYPKNDDFSLAKYFLSYLELKQKYSNAFFFVCTNTVIENAGCFTEIDKNQFTFFPKIGKCYQLRVSSNKFQTCVEEYMKNSKSIRTATEIADNIPVFLKVFHYISINDNSLAQHITNLTENLGKKLQLELSTEHFLQKMHTWFMETNGFFLKKSYVKAFIFEYIHKKSIEKLKTLKIQFNRLYLPDKQILHSTAGEDILLKMSRLYHELLNEYKPENILIMEITNDQSSSLILKQLIEVFELPRFTFLIIVTNEMIDKEITSYLKNLVERIKFKRVFILSKHFMHTENVHEINFKVSFNDLIDSCKHNILQANCKFQEKKMSITSMLDPFQNSANEIIDGDMLTKFATNQEIVIESIISDFSVITPLYMTRDLIRQNEVIPDEDFGLAIANGKNKFILISDIAGMGKSTMLTRLENIAKQNSNCFIIRINLNLHTKMLSKFNKSKEKLMQLEDFLKFPLTTVQERLFHLQQKVILMVDAVDEISPDYSDIVLHFLRESVEQKNIRTVVVTTRFHLQTRLEKIFYVKAVNLKPLSDIDQIRLLCCFWKTSLKFHSKYDKKCEEYAKILLKDLNDSIGFQAQSLVGIPLQTIMIADIFQSGTNCNWTCCEQFIRAAEGVVFTKKINLGILYSTFIEKKRQIFIEDKCNTQGNLLTTELCNERFEYSLKMHQKLALKLFLDHKKCKLFNFYRDTSMDENAYGNIMKMGILQQSEDEITFVHQTFAEYFVALSITNELKYENNSLDELIFYLLGTIFVGDRYGMIRCFIECFLKDTKLNDSILVTLRQSVKDIQWDVERNFGCLAKEGCLEILKLIFDEAPSSKGILEVRDEFKRTAIHHAIAHFPVTKYLMQLGVDLNTKDILGRTAVHLAALRNEVSIVMFLVNNGADIGVNDNSGNSLLHFSSVVNSTALAHISLNGTDLNTKNNDSWTALHTAALHNSLEVIKFLVKKGCDLNKKTDRGQTALHFVTMSSESNDSEILATIKYLFFQGADINITDCHGRTALFPAISRGNLTVAKFLVEQGCDVNATDNNGVTLLHIAAEEGWISLIKYLIGENVVMEKRNNRGQTALHYAATKDSIHVVKFLVDQGFDMDVSDYNGNTILHTAAKNGSQKTIRFLTDEKCIIGSRNNEGQTVLVFAISGNGSISEVKFLVEHGCDVHSKDNNGVILLHRAAEKGAIEIVKYLIDEKGVRDSRDNAGRSTLHYAISTRNPFELITFLSKHGCDINARDKNGESALHLAARYGRSDTVEYLIAQKAVTDIRNYEGENALHSASSSLIHLDLHVVRILIDGGCDVNARDNYERTPLHWFAAKGAIEIVKYLIDEKGITDSRDLGGKSILFYAVRSNKLDILKFLINRGFDVFSIDKNGKTLLHAAAEIDSHDIVEHLVEKTVDLNARDSTGRTALHISALNNSIRVAVILMKLGADESIIDNSEETALDIAKKKSLQLVPYLINHNNYNPRKCK